MDAEEGEALFWSHISDWKEKEPVIESDFLYLTTGKNGSRNTIGCHRALTSGPTEARPACISYVSTAPSGNTQVVSIKCSLILWNSTFQKKCTVSLSWTLGICKSDGHSCRHLKSQWEAFNVKYLKAKGLLSLSDNRREEADVGDSDLRAWTSGFQFHRVTAGGVNWFPHWGWSVSLQIFQSQLPVPENVSVCGNRAFHY